MRNCENMVYKVALLYFWLYKIPARLELPGLTTTAEANHYYHISRHTFKKRSRSLDAFQNKRISNAYSPGIP